MLLAVDIGNTNIKFGIFDGETLLSKFSILTNSDSLDSVIGDRLDPSITDAIVCSVVRTAEASIKEYLIGETRKEPDFVRNDWDFGLTIDYEPLESVGTDRLVNASAASVKYGVPCIVCSFGTAVTIDVVTKDHEFIGGVIAPGIDTLSKALHINTARLPNVDLKMPDKVIQNTTTGSINSGVAFGYIGMVEGLVKRIKDEVGGHPKVIGTGGSVSLISDNTSLLDVVDETLLLEGLRLIYNRRHPV